MPSLQWKHACPCFIVRRAWVSLNFFLAWPCIEKVSLLCAPSPGLLPQVQVYVPHQVLDGTSRKMLNVQHSPGNSPWECQGAAPMDPHLSPHMVRHTTFHSHCLPWGFAPGLASVRTHGSNVTWEGGSGPISLQTWNRWIPPDTYGSSASPLFSSCNPRLSSVCLINKSYVVFPSHNSQECPCI